ncbi:MAG: hypothetical protein JNJ54_21280 [Myxococcaceae bacterium]|nr:hypothetical protein [Myxococcaceae bacterium]
MSSVSAFIAVCLFVSILPESPEQQLLAAVALGILVLGAFLAARAFDEMTTRCLRDAVAARFVVDSVEKVRSVGQEWAWQGYLVGLTGRDPPHLKLTVRADETTELVPGSTEVLALSADRGEYLVLGLSDREVATGRPAGPNDRRFLASGW